MICIVPGSLLPLGVGRNDTELGSGSFDTLHGSFSLDDCMMPWRVSLVFFFSWH